MYDKLDFSRREGLRKGIELRRVAVLESCTVKNALRFLGNGSFLILEVYDENERKLFELSQNELAELFTKSDSPYDTLGNLKRKGDFTQNKG